MGWPGAYELLAPDVNRLNAQAMALGHHRDTILIGLAQYPN
jgi:hypothetical protein